jgi:neutral amino acid transport system ATP-binding protein
MTAQNRPAPVLEVVDVRAGYREVNVLNDVNLRVGRGEIVAIIGPNGCGKSTLLKTIYGLLHLRHGTVTFNGGETSRSLAGLAPYRITALGLNYLPQRNNVFEDLSVRENLEVGHVTRGRPGLHSFDRVFDLFPVIKDRQKARAGTLSGGQRQMLALARALVTEPELLLLDEPSAGLAPMIVEEIFDRLRAINAGGTSLLLVEQSARRALEMADYAYVLDLGQNSHEGTGAELLDNPEVVEVFVGVKRVAAGTRHPGNHAVDPGTGLAAPDQEPLQ